MADAAQERLRELEERVLQLQEENEHLAERQADTALLGLVSEHVHLESEPDAILRVALEQASILKDVPLCAVGERDGDELVLRHAYLARSGARLDGRRLRLSPQVVEELRGGATLLEGADCQGAGLGPATLDGFAPGSALLVPFSCRPLPRGIFVFGDDGPGGHLPGATPVLARVVETVAARLENVALLHELLGLNAALDEKVAERTRELTAANEALRQSEARLRLALSAAAMASVEWDLERGQLAWSEGAAALLGSAPPTPEAWLAAVHPEDRAAVAALLAAAPQGQRTRLEHRTAAAPDRWLELHAGAVGPGGAPARRVTGVLVDVTDRRRLEEELRQAQKLDSIGRLAGGIAHDFNNLLTTILGVGELLSNDLPPGSAMAADAATILEAGRHAAALTRQLLAFSRKQRLEVHPLRLDEVCRAFSPMLARLIGEEIEVRLDLDVAAPAVLADRSQVEQVLMNLAINARDAMPRGGRLTIEVAQASDAPGRPPGLPPGRWVRLSVADSGAGMAPEVAAKAFEPFFTTKERGKGTGLGLATVYGVVSQHGGHARLTTAPGRGARFDLYLPQADPEAGPPAPARAPDDLPGGGETLLVVDDEPSIRRVLRLILERLGYRVLEAKDGAAALELLERSGAHIDALLADVVMPGLRGPELALAFQDRFPGRPVILMSGYAEGQEVPLEDGAVLPKPLTRQAVARAVRDALDAARRRAPP